jgi:hypothetical protein
MDQCIAGPTFCARGICVSHESEKPLDRHDLTPQTLALVFFYWHNSSGVTELSVDSHGPLLSFPR